MDWNWFSDEAPRMARNIREVVAEVKDAIPTAKDLKEIWRKIRAALNRALEPHPEVKTAVLRELEAEFVPEAV